MKTIVFFIYDIYSGGGTEKVLSLIANELSKNNHVKIISLYKTSEKPFFQIDNRIEIINIFGSKKFLHFNYMVPYFRFKIKKIIKKFDIDDFICAGMRYVPLTIKLKRRVRYIAWEHYNSFFAPPGNIVVQGRKLAAKYANKIVVLTDKDRMNNIKLFKTPKDKIVRIYNPIESKLEEHNYDINSKYLLSSGRICEAKGFDMLVQVAKKVLKKHPDWKWHIYGDGEDKEKIQQLINENDLNDKVILMGRTNKMNELYKNYSIFVMTSRNEGFAMVNIEAHYSKLPIISFNCNCGPDEVIQDGVNGYLIDCFDIEKMADKINYLIERGDIRKEMSDNTILDKEKLRMKTIINEWESIL